MKVMIVVTHLLGTGHLARALTLARAYAAAGDRAYVVSGGMPVPMMDQSDITFVQLPPVRSDGVDFATLLDDRGEEVTQETMNARQRMLVEAFDASAPDLLITELFPFGRRILREEFQTLLGHAKNQPKPPLVCASIRDILAPPSKPKKALFADEMIERYYDAVLVHSDAEITPLDLSWPVSDRLRPLLHYTGFVAPPAAPPHPDATGAGEILVSAGGGDVGGPVYDAALGSAAFMPHPMRILVGGSAPQDRISALRAQAPDGVIVEQARPDFRQLLHHAAASVSLCGYNTALDILHAGTPAVFIPFDEGNEVEQGIRASALSRYPDIATLRRADLSPRSLSDAVRTVINAQHRAPRTAGFDGASQTVEITHKLRACR